jgi:hypothetical protein
MLDNGRWRRKENQTVALSKKSEPVAADLTSIVIFSLELCRVVCDFEVCARAMQGRVQPRLTIAHRARPHCTRLHAASHPFEQTPIPRNPCPHILLAAQTHALEYTTPPFLYLHDPASSFVFACSQVRVASQAWRTRNHNRRPTARECRRS